MRIMKSLLVITLLLLVLTGRAEAAGRFDPYGELKWMQEKSGKLSADPTLTDNGLLYCPVGNKILCYDVNRGVKLWERKADVGGKITEPLLVQEQTIYATGTEGIQQMKPNGSLTWVYRVYPKPKGTKSSGVVSTGPGELIYFGVADGIYALEPKKNYQWRYSDEDNVAACLGNDRYVYVSLKDAAGTYSLSALDPEGDRVWHQGWGKLKNIRLTFAPDGNLLVVTNPASLGDRDYGRVRCLNPETGKEIWNYSVKADDITAVSFSTEGKIFFTANSRLFCLDDQTGLLDWNLPLLNVSSGAAVDDSKKRIYAGSTDGRIFCVSFAGRVIWDKEVDKTVSQEMHKDGGFMVDTGKDDKDSFSRAPILLKNGELLIYSDKGTIFKFVDIHKEG
ncbi:PQQ-binding-like beta-propeller repeat protein [Desulforamulus ruminis]|uniref:Pyrrolo-quinoline quinone n=1 Tax=Desulforamulus ruminis (strain ATCC 23193 / DSM 2154 / NCIMB 8452 / DL) TaxID=696281 RepID=F6DPJ8_DESRL|nr:PQQ-binding-like beta-propeller repeat protein [Desulforamulus ruminis]AEG59575.1 pyrrolo-quinoline quinone [Desulforamulus ruminis DSM 2154]